MKTQRGFRKGNELYLATARCHKEGMSKCVCERKKKVWRRMCFVRVELVIWCGLCGMCVVWCDFVSVLEHVSGRKV